MLIAFPVDFFDCRACEVAGGKKQYIIFITRVFLHLPGKSYREASQFDIHVFEWWYMMLSEVFASAEPFSFERHVLDFPYLVCTRHKRKPHFNSMLQQGLVEEKHFGVKLT